MNPCGSPCSKHTNNVIDIFPLANTSRISMIWLYYFHLGPSALLDRLGACSHPLTFELSEDCPPPPPAVFG